MSIFFFLVNEKLIGGGGGGGELRLLLVLLPSSFNISAAFFIRSSSVKDLSTPEDFSSAKGEFSMGGVNLALVGSFKGIVLDPMSGGGTDVNGLVNVLGIISGIVRSDCVPGMGGSFS